MVKSPSHEKCENSDLFDTSYVGEIVQLLLVCDCYVVY